MALPTFGAAYDAAECLEILQLASAVDSFLPAYAPEGQPGYLLPSQPATGSPFAAATQDLIPSIFYNRWPSDWQAAFTKGALGNLDWAWSIVESSLGNQAILAGLVSQTSTPTYALAFRGTMTGVNVLEDFFAIPVTAQPIPAGELKTLIPADIWNALPAAVQTVLNTIGLSKSYVNTAGNISAESALVHLGFRLALESLDTLATELPEQTKPVPVMTSLSGRIQALLSQLPAGVKEINLYVTGHSLGAGLASLAAAWLATQPFSGYTINVKCYAFAQPKPGNDYFAYATALAFQNQGFGFYTVLNTLDTVPQVPLTIQTSKDLNYWEGIEAIAQAAGASQLVDDLFNVINTLNLPYNLNYTRVGTPIILNGAPVTTASPQTPADTYTFPLNGNATVYYPTYLVSQGSGTGVVPPSQWNIATLNTAGPTINSTTSNLWQHMPWTYQQLLYLTLPTA
ncbi:hypothetical protein M2352_002465 [Azospirillum fermentarium]|uniref:lipase family protein n=1 Tax=Azospirillum fermentarium TaxID=1233114 RepID=UPI002226275B|nr:hypothetical protein [Azospirillum fermentarium]MCW2246874.1 hypothetical protein [Azospirillum fermentarium]